MPVDGSGTAEALHVISSGQCNHNHSAGCFVRIRSRCDERGATLPCLRVVGVSECTQDLSVTRARMSALPPNTPPMEEPSVWKADAVAIPTCAVPTPTAFPARVRRPTDPDRFQSSYVCREGPPVPGLGRSQGKRPLFQRQTRSTSRSVLVDDLRGPVLSHLAVRAHVVRLAQCVPRVYSDLPLPAGTRSRRPRRRRFCRRFGLTHCRDRLHATRSDQRGQRRPGRGDHGYAWSRLVLPTSVTPTVTTGGVSARTITAPPSAAVPPAKTDRKGRTATFRIGLSRRSTRPGELMTRSEGRRREREGRSVQHESGDSSEGRRIISRRRASHDPIVTRHLSLETEIPPDPPHSWVPPITASIDA